MPRHPFGPGWRSAALLAAALAVSACASYAPAPLGEGRGATDPDQLSVSAASMPVRELATHRFDPADGLDVTETAMLAVANNPWLKVKRDALGVARAQAFAAGLLPDPQLALSRDLPSKGQSSDDLSSAFSLGLSYDVGALLARSSQRAAANGVRDQVRLELLWAEWQAVAQARLLFGQVLSLRAQEQLLRREVAALQPLDAQVQRALVAGNLTYDAASVGLNAMADARRRLAETSRQRRQAEHDLRLLLGLAPQAPLQLVGPAYRAAPDPAQLQRALDRLPQRRPDLLALQAGYAAQEARVRGAIIAQFPAINLGFVRARDTSHVYTDGLSLGITLPLFDRNRGNIAIERATRQQLRDDYEARLLGARGDMLQLQQDLALLQAQIGALAAHAHQLDAARSAAARAWQANLLDWPTYLVIRSNALGADLDLAALREEQARQAIALDTLLGGDWTDQPVATTPPSPTLAQSTTPGRRR